MAIEKYDATITFESFDGIQSTSQITDIPLAAAPDMTKLLTLATAIKDISNAAIFGYALLGWEEDAVTDATVISGTNSDKGLVSYQWEDTAGILQHGLLWIPNPSLAHYEIIEGTGQRMLASSRALLEAALSAASGETITVTEGKVAYKSSKKGRARTMNSLEFEDETGGMAYMSFPLASSLSALTTLASSLVTNAFSTSQIKRAFFLTKEEAQPVQGSGIGLAVDAPFTSVESRVTAKFSFIVGGLRKYMRFTIPAPILANTQIVGKGREIVKADGQTLAAAFTTFFGAGRTVVFVSSGASHKDIYNQ